MIVGQRPNSPNFELAISHGFDPVSLDEASRLADIVNILLPDEVQADLYREQIGPHLVRGNILMLRTD